MVMAGFGEGRGDGGGRKQGRSGEKLHFPHHNSPEFHPKRDLFLPDPASSYAVWRQKCGKMVTQAIFPRFFDT
jgi:hypothetical protein